MKKGIFSISIILALVLISGVFALEFKECNKCEYNSNGKISCKSTEYCGLDALDISKEKCQEGNGLYQKLYAETKYSCPEDC